MDLPKWQGQKGPKSPSPKGQRPNRIAAFEPRGLIFDGQETGVIVDKKENPDFYIGVSRSLKFKLLP
jgi:hypothetical protein